MPGTTDPCVRVANDAAELDRLRRGALCPIPSNWRHRAGSPGRDAADEAFVRDAVRRWLDA